LYINIHSHHAGAGIVIQNYYSHFAAIPEAGYCSAGLHPWYITETTWQQEFDTLTKAIAQKNIVAVGECGLDKICTTDFALQQKLFAAQIQLANTISKPLIIHCVKAFDEVLQLLQQQQNKVPVIFHGFNKSKELAIQLISRGYYLSFGRALEQPHLQTVLAALPVENIFLETDDAAISIENSYNLAAAALQIDVNALSLQLQKNAALVFGIPF
jgi:TatD DNase family protein